MSQNLSSAAVLMGSLRVLLVESDQKYATYNIFKYQYFFKIPNNIDISSELSDSFSLKIKNMILIFCLR